MIQRSQLIDMIVNHPALYSVRYTKKPDLNPAVVGSYVNAAVDRIVIDHEWDFALDVADEAIVSGQSDYVLKGNTNDCRQIFNVRYGSGTSDEGYRLLDKRTKASVDEYLNERTITGVYLWVLIERAGQYPKIRVVDTPSDTSKQLRYRYWVRDFEYEAFPDGCNFDLLVMDAVLEELVPEYRRAGHYLNRLRQVIDAYEPPGGEDNPMVIDQYTRQRNNERNRMYGYGRQTITRISDE